MTINDEYVLTILELQNECIEQLKKELDFYKGIVHAQHNIK